MVAELVALVVAFLAVAAEWIHIRRVRRVAALAFGPDGEPAVWARGAPALRSLSLAALAWGLTTLLLIEPKVHRTQVVDKEKLQRLVLVLDVSPSMRLTDAGPTGKQSRMHRTRDLMESFFARSGMAFRVTVVATYNGAKPVVIDTTDLEVVRNILGDLPMHYAFEVGQTRLFDGLEEAAKLAHPWPPQSASLLVLTDGDTVPPTGMPKLPPSISQTLIVGVGDPQRGSFIDGRQSRQDSLTLRQSATRLHGIYHNGNEKQIDTKTLRLVTQAGRVEQFDRLTRREYALLAVALSALVYGALPWLLHVAGTAWRPGAPDAARPSAGAGRKKRRFARPLEEAVS